jgi:Prokaryotic RING finger family 1
MSAGAPCPYCHFAIKEGARSVPCNRCGTFHHAECWQENGGCAVPGCAAVSAPIAAPPPTWSPPPPPAPMPARTRSTAWRAIVVGAAVAVALLGAGAALLLLRQPSTPVAQTTTHRTRTVVSQTTVTITTQSTVITTQPSPVPRPRHLIPNLARYGAPQNATGPGNGIQQYWTLVNEGDYQGAWDMETSNEQRFWTSFVATARPRSRRSTSSQSVSRAISATGRRSCGRGCTRRTAIRHRAATRSAGCSRSRPTWCRRAAAGSTTGRTTTRTRRSRSTAARTATRSANGC